MPRIVDPASIDAFTAALRTQRDRAMIDAMLLGGLRRCEVPGLRFADINAGERRVFIAEGKGGHERIVRSRRGSSLRWLPAWPTNALTLRARIGCSSR